MLKKSAQGSRFLLFPVLLLSLLLAACQDTSAGPEVGTDLEDVAGAAPELTEPVAEEEALDPALVGQQVTVSADVSEVVSPAAFVLGEDTLSSVLVVSAPAADFGEIGLTVDDALADDDTVVTVTGTVRQFDIAGFEEEFGVDYDDELFEVYEGQSVIVADRVRTLVGQELRIAGEVEEILSTVAFRLAGTEWDVLVLDAQQAAVSEDDFVQVDGTVARLDIADVEERLGVDLDDALYEPFEGEFVLLAQSVQEIPAAPAP